MRKKRQKRGAHLTGTGAYSGGRYGEYRYGENLTNRDGTTRRIYVPGKPLPKPVLNKEKREHVVTQVTEQLRAWTSSPFQYEGTLRAGIRSGLCLDGNDWDRSDITAADIVAEGLRNLRAVRPSHEEAQWNFTIAREDCARCGLPIDDEGIASGHRFCSPDCARFAAASREAETLRREDELIRNAQRVVRDHKSQAMECSHCKKPFRNAAKTTPSYLARGTRNQYCSRKCFNAAKKVLEDRECKWCSKVFSPEISRQEHCSKACATKTAHRVRWVEQVATRPERECPECRRRFKPRQENSLFCSRPCAMLAYRRQHKHRKEVATAVELFDHYFTLPINASRPVWLTPERFDQMMAG